MYITITYTIGRNDNHNTKFHSNGVSSKAYKKIISLWWPHVYLSSAVDCDVEVLLKVWEAIYFKILVLFI